MQLEPQTPVIIHDPQQWTEWVAQCPPRSGFSSTARGAFLVRPDGFALATESASDNQYMASGNFDAERAKAQHLALTDALELSLPLKIFPGHAETPDAVFPNNVFATVPGKLIIGAMRHPVRQRESLRADIPQWFERHHGYAQERLDHPGVVAELTGPLIIDHARQVGYCGMSDRVNAAGARAMLSAFGLRALFAFDLVPGEYHTNVVMSVLAGRMLVLHAASVADPLAAKAIASAYGDQVLWLTDAEKAAFVGNCIAMRDDEVWMSRAADLALTPEHRDLFLRSGFSVRSVDISEIEKAGGSLRCCIGEIW